MSDEKPSGEPDLELQALAVILANIRACNMDNKTLAAGHLGVFTAGRIRPGNIAFEAFRRAGVIDNEGWVDGPDFVRKALSILIRERQEAGTWQ